MSSELFLRLGSAAAVVAVGQAAKSLGLLSQAEGQAILKVIFNLTLPSGARVLQRCRRAVHRNASMLAQLRGSLHRLPRGILSHQVKERVLCRRQANRRQSKPLCAGATPLLFPAAVLFLSFCTLCASSAAVARVASIAVAHGVLMSVAGVLAFKDRPSKVRHRRKRPPRLHSAHPRGLRRSFPQYIPHIGEGGRGTESFPPSFAICVALSSLSGRGAARGRQHGTQPGRALTRTNPLLRDLSPKPLMSL